MEHIKLMYSLAAEQTSKQASIDGYRQCHNYLYYYYSPYLPDVHRGRGLEEPAVSKVEYIVLIHMWV